MVNFLIMSYMVNCASYNTFWDLNLIKCSKICVINLKMKEPLFIEIFGTPKQIRENILK
jgi:hypothetical protein